MAGAALVLVAACGGGHGEEDAADQPLHDVDGSDETPGELDTDMAADLDAADRTGDDGPPQDVPDEPDGVSPTFEMPLISRWVPSFSSGDTYPAQNANDDDYDSEWRSSGSLPVWIAYDLSGVPAAQRGQVLVAWYNSGTYPYDISVRGADAYNLPGDYTIDTHSGAGGGSPPAQGDAGWQTVATVTANQLHSRQHLFDLAEGNWVRMRVTAVNGSADNEDAAVNLDVYDAHEGAVDSWMFYGDSITNGCWHAGLFGNLIQASRPGNFPAAENGGIGGLTAQDLIDNIDRWLPLFPGRYVGISYGTNDAAGAIAPDDFYAEYETIVTAVLGAGKIPVIPTIPYCLRDTLLANLPALNAKLAELKTNYPQIVDGPDLYAFFEGHPELFGDDVHPNGAGYEAMAQQWAEAMLANVYGATP
jgi:lysophospholipase L1-like esterase